MTLDEIRRRPTLPGRFQPSTISVLRLNFCVRDGNRWIPQAIVTGNLLCKPLLLPPFLLPSVRQYNCLPTALFQYRPLSGFCTGCPDTSCLSHPQNRTGWRLRPARPRRPFPPSTLSHKPSRSDLFFRLSELLNSSLLTPNSSLFQDQALDRLVSPSSTRYRASTDDLSTLSSSRGLTRF